MATAGGVEIEAVALRHSFDAPAGTLTVLDGIDLFLPAGGYASVMGRSGSGKSTLLSLIGGLERPQEGSLRVGDDDLSTLHGNELASYRSATVGFVFQHFGLLETLTAAENVELALSLTGRRRDRASRARDLLASVGLAARADHRPAALSGGERQRVAIARALANEPSLLLADEPTGNLDDEAAAATIQLLETIAAARGATLVIVTHNHVIAERATTRLAIRDAQVTAA